MTRPPTISAPVTNITRIIYQASQNSSVGNRGNNNTAAAASSIAQNLERNSRKGLFRCLANNGFMDFSGKPKPKPKPRQQKQSARCLIDNQFINLAGKPKPEQQEQIRVPTPLSQSIGSQSSDNASHSTRTAYLNPISTWANKEAEAIGAIVAKHQIQNSQEAQGISSFLKRIKQKIEFVQQHDTNYTPTASAYWTEEIKKDFNNLAKAVMASENPNKDNDLNTLYNQKITILGLLSSVPRHPSNTDKIGETWKNNVISSANHLAEQVIESNTPNKNSELKELYHQQGLVLNLIKKIPDSVPATEVRYSANRNNARHSAQTAYLNPISAWANKEAEAIETMVTNHQIQNSQEAQEISSFLKRIKPKIKFLQQHDKNDMHTISAHWQTEIGKDFDKLARAIRESENPNKNDDLNTLYNQKITILGLLASVPRHSERDTNNIGEIWKDNISHSIEHIARQVMESNIPNKDSELNELYHQQDLITTLLAKIPSNAPEAAARHSDTSHKPKAQPDAIVSLMLELMTEKQGAQPDTVNKLLSHATSLSKKTSEIDTVKSQLNASAEKLIDAMMRDDSIQADSATLNKILDYSESLAKAKTPLEIATVQSQLEKSINELRTTQVQNVPQDIINELLNYSTSLTKTPREIDAAKSQLRQGFEKLMSDITSNKYDIQPDTINQLLDYSESLENAKTPREIAVVQSNFEKVLKKLISTTNRKSVQPATIDQLLNHSNSLERANTASDIRIAKHNFKKTIGSIFDQLSRSTSPSDVNTFNEIKREIFDSLA